MIDATLRERLLPPELIIKKFVHGEKQCNYEVYLREFVNHSSFFRDMSKDEPYHNSPTESNSEWDCISVHYSIDFKLVAAKTALQASSILSEQKTVIPKIGAIIGSAPKMPNSQMKATRIHAALRSYSIESLQKLRQNIVKTQSIENDIIELLETLETEKNLLLFFPYSFRYDTNKQFDEGVSQIIDGINKDFFSAILYRQNRAPAYDTYFCFIYDGYMVFLEAKDNNFCFIDKVELQKSTTFQKLLRYTRFY